MKVLCFISEDFYFLSHRRELLIGLQRAGVDIRLVTNLASKADEVQATGIPVYHVDLQRRSLSPLSVLRGARIYSRLIAQIQPDVTFAVALKPIVTLAIATLRRPTPMLCAFAGLGSAFSEAGSPSLRLVRWAMERVFRPLFRRRNCYCLFQNCADHSLFLSRGWTTPDRATVVRGAGIALDKFSARRSPETGEVAFLFVGRLLWQKGVRELVDACRELQARGLRVRCKVAGLIDTTNRTAVPLKYMEEQQRAGIVEWLGPRSDVPELMLQANCLVFPTKYREGVPKVLLEAGAAGLAAITSDIPGCRDVVTPGVNGLLIAPGDTSSLADAMAACVANPEKLRQMGREARARAEREFGVERVVDSHLRILSEMNYSLCVPESLFVKPSRRHNTERRPS